jgi:protein SCO1/2
MAGASAASAAGAVPIPPSTNRRDFPNVTLVTHESRIVRFYDDLVKGKIVLFNFFYTRCEGVCIPATANLRKVQDLLGDRIGRDIFMYSISLKPEEDRPRDLKAYREAYDITSPGWTFLTGPKKHCELLRRRLGFADIDPERDKDVTQHSGLVVFGNEPLDSWTACPALATATEIVKAVSWVDWR